MIEFKDFAPEVRKESNLFSQPSFEEFSESLKRANEWVESDNVDVVNIETVVVPNIHRPNEEGTTDVDLQTYGGSHWHQFIRVWYRAESDE